VAIAKGLRKAAKRYQAPPSRKQHQLTRRTTSYWRRSKHLLKHTVGLAIPKRSKRGHLPQATPLFLNDLAIGPTVRNVAHAS
jgi:hypothetical protein